MQNLKTKTSRLRLKPNSNGYAQNLASGRALLYRKRTANQPGRWVLRTAKPQGGYAFETLGVADDFDDGMTYAQALSEALSRTNADPTKITVEAALDAWLQKKHRSEASNYSKQNNVALTRRLAATFPNATLQTITAQQIAKWMNDRVDAAEDTRARKATCNRELATLKAALTAAADLNGYEGPRAWNKVKKYPKTDSHGNRKVILTEEQEAALIAAADPDLAIMMTALQMTGTRFGEMRQVRVGDLQGRMLDIPASKTKRRTISLSESQAAWFAARAGNRPPEEPIIIRDTLGQWSEGGHTRPVRRAAAAAGLPSGVTVYALRHGFISRALARGVPIAAVAMHCGTSVQMIMDSYAKFAASEMSGWFG